MEMDWDFVIRPRLQVLSSQEAAYFYGRALDVLERIGVRIMHPEAIELLKGAGAFVADDSIVRLRPRLVDDAIHLRQIVCRIAPSR